MSKIVVFLIVFFGSVHGGFGAELLPEKVTFSEHIAPLVFENCTSCHRPGQVAPFSLLNYSDTRKHGKTMLRVVKDHYMPPWQPDRGEYAFRNERRLSEDKIALFEKWVETGMAEGDPKKVPELPKFAVGWQLGKPDLIVKMSRPFQVPSEGPDIYQNFVIPLPIQEDKWVTAVEFRASAPEVVHHILYFLDNSGRARAKEKTTGQPGFQGMGFRPTGSLGGWAVGATPIRLPEGIAYPLKKGSDLVLQTHFHLAGKAVNEELTVGLFFANKPPERTLVNLALPPAFGIFSKVQIPPGQTLKVTDSYKLPVDVDVFGAGSHAHYLGKTMKTTAKLPDGEVKTLFSIHDWDFNWQGQYIYKDFIRLPKGTEIRGEVTWDNTAENPRNPSSPPIAVEWGEGSKDEMGQVNLLMVPAEEANKDTLRNGVRNHVLQTGLRSRFRGDVIHWEKLGIDPPAFWKDASPGPGQKKNSDPKSQAFFDLDGKEHKPLQVDKGKANVLIFTTTDCPIANSYIPEINKMAQEFDNSSIKFFAIQVDPELSVEDAKKHQKAYELKIPVIRDTEHRLVKATTVTHTPEVAVVIPDGTIVYKGRIDDRYPSIGKKRSAPNQRDLYAVLSSIAKGDKPTATTTPAVGCFIPELPGNK